jgi:hypothetical protein
MPISKTIRVSLPEPARWSASFIPDRMYNGIAVHGRISRIGAQLMPDPTRGYAVTHVNTGYSIAKFNTFDAAIEFFNLIGDWPEWQVAKTVEDTAFLKERVRKAYKKAKKLEQ